MDEEYYEDCIAGPIQKKKEDSDKERVNNR